jgi:transcription initiation factor TFIIIB Brf1 subunit/transcription initiation factor TFIIB
MSCKECGMNKFNFNDLLGEKECFYCGLVVIEELFEKTQLGIYTEGDKTQMKENDTRVGSLGSHIGKTSTHKDAKLRRTSIRYSKSSFDQVIGIGLKHCMFILSEYPVSNRIKEQVNKHYTSLLVDHHLNGWTYDERAGAIVFYTLKDNGIRTSIKEISKYSGTDSTRIHKLSRKIARVFHRPWVLSQSNPIGDLEKYSQDLGQDFSFTRDCIKVYSSLITVYERHGKQFSLGALSAIIHITSLLINSKLTQMQISKALEITPVSIRSNVKQIFNMLNITDKLNNRYYLRTLTLEEFIHGVFK